MAAGEHQLWLPAPRMRGALLRDHPGLAILARRSPLTRLTLTPGLIQEGEAGETAREAQCRLERLRQALRGIGAHAHAVDDRLDGVLLLRVELRQRVHLVDAPVDAHAYESLAGEILEQLEVLALALAHHRGEQRRGSALGQPQHLVHHLAHRLRGEVDAVIGATRRAGARIQQPQVIVDLGHRADGGARIVRVRLLLDGNRGREPLDAVDVGLVHGREKLPRVSRQRLDVAALTFGVERVEGERGFSRPREARDDDQPLPRQIEAQVLQVMGACTADANLLH